MLTTAPGRVRHWNMRRGLFSLPRGLAAANPTACLASGASVFAENVHRGGGISPCDGLHSLWRRILEGVPS